MHQRKHTLLLGLLIVGFTSLCMFPIWPHWAKVGAWYISVTLLILILSLSIVRLVVFCTFWGLGFDFWILPNIFADDLGVYDSFIPLYTFGKATDWNSTWYFRFAMIVAILAACVWVYNQARGRVCV